MLFRSARLALALTFTSSLAAAQPSPGPASDGPIVQASDPRCHAFDDPVRWRTPRIPDARPRLVLEHACLQRIEARLGSEEVPGLIPLGAAMMIVGGAGALSALFVAVTTASFERTFGAHSDSAGTLGGIGASLLLIGAIVLTFGLESSARVDRRLVAGRRRRIEDALMTLARSPDGAALTIGGSF